LRIAFFWAITLRRSVDGFDVLGQRSVLIFKGLNGSSKSRKLSN